MPDAKRRLERYPNIDGVLEVTLGLCNTVVGFIPLLMRFELVIAILPLIILLLFLGLLLFKQRVTYLRTGYAVARGLSPYTLGALVVPFAMMFSRYLLPEDTYLLNQGYPVFFASFLAITMLLVGRGLERFYLYAGVALTVGTGGMLMRLDPDTTVSAVALATGLVLLVFGFLTLRRYLREHPLRV